MKIIAFIHLSMYKQDTRIEKIKDLNLTSIWFFTSTQESCFGLFWPIGQFADGKNARKKD
jgi:hypothetical protein